MKLPLFRTKMKGDVNILTTIHSYITSLLAQAHKHLLICFIYRFTRTLNNIFGPQIYLVHDRCFCPFICALYSKGKKKKLYEIERYEISVTVFSSFFFCYFTIIIIIGNHFHYSLFHYYFLPIISATSR